MIRVFIDNDLVRIPKPVIAVVVIVRRNAEVEIANPETAPVSSAQVENVARPETAREMAVLPRMVEMIMRIVPPGVMADPLIVAVDVWRVWVTTLVGKLTAFLGTGPLIVKLPRSIRSLRVAYFGTLGLSTLNFRTLSLLTLNVGTLNFRTLGFAALNFGPLNLRTLSLGPLGFGTLSLRPLNLGILRLRLPS